MQICNICTEGSDQNQPKEKEMRKQTNKKRLSERALQIAEKGREAKGKKEVEDILT